MRELAGTVALEDTRVAIVVSRWNAGVTDALLEGARATLVAEGIAEEHLIVVRVPGAFEIPGAVAHLLDAQLADAIVTLGAVIRGDTPHFEFIARECCSGLMTLTRQTPVPIAMGVLTCDTMEQALERAGGRMGNKGSEAARTALEMLATHIAIANAAEVISS